MESAENIDEFLKKIEEKYSWDNSSSEDDLHNQLCILSQEFETLGLPPIELTQPVSKLLFSVVSNTFALIQTHRKTLGLITDMNITHRAKDLDCENFKKSILQVKTKLQAVEGEKLNLERKLFKLNCENEGLTKRISMHSRETEQLKKYYKSKQNQLTHRINNLDNENQHLKEMCCKDFDRYFSKEEKFLKILRSYRCKEDSYKEALRKLEENNAEIMNEILNLKEELATAYLKRTKSEVNDA